MGAPSAMGQGPSTLTKTGHDTITTTTNKLSSSDQQPSDLEKDQDQDQAPAPNQEDHASTGSSGEVFHETAEGVNFRTVSWQRATVLFLKIQFAMSILAVPSSLGTLGAVGGALSIVGWQLLNTYTSIILGDFRNRHPECHTLADMCSLPLGRFGRELVGLMILIAQVLIVAAGDVSIATAFNALSTHGACTAVFTLVAALLVTGFSSLRTFAKLGWLTWFGFATFVVAVLIFTVAVTQQDRPAAAPPPGTPFDLGFVAWAAVPGFAAGMTATLNIFISGSGSSMYLPILAEMRHPRRDYPKAAYLAGFLVGALYLTFSLVIYRYCGVWLASPAFGSAGPLFKKISYGVALPGLVIGTGIYSHVAAKYLFVRVLRGSRHLQGNTATHWLTWLGINVGLGTLSYLVAEAVPILNYLLALAGALCFAPFSLIFPALLWMYDYKHQHVLRRTGSRWVRDTSLYAFHALILLVGAFLVVGGTYGAALSIKEAFADGTIGGVFVCADNSGSVA